MAAFLARRRGMIIAFILGLVLASAGTATAARLITSKDIKNGTIKEKDLAKPVRTKLNASGTQGPQGPKGDQGPKGEQGAKGERGPAGPSWAAAGTAGANSTQGTANLEGYTQNGYPQGFNLPEAGPVLAATTVTIDIDCQGAGGPGYSCGTNWALAIDGQPLQGSSFGTTTFAPGPTTRELTLFGTLANLPAGQHDLRVYTKQILGGGASSTVNVVSWSFSVQRVGSIG